MQFPEIKPVRIPTKGKPWYIQVFIFLFHRRKWEMANDYYIYIPWMHIVVKIPAGFIFDGASIPLVIQKIFFYKPTGILFLPALLHDFGYAFNCWLDQNHKKITDSDGNVFQGRCFFDWQFRKYGVHINGMPIISGIAWVGLHLGSWYPWRRRRKESRDVFTDFPVPSRGHEKE